MREKTIRSKGGFVQSDQLTIRLDDDIYRIREDHFDGTAYVFMLPEEALKLARWILETEHARAEANERPEPPQTDEDARESIKIDSEGNRKGESN